jgi:Domain of unknown function (DUF1338)
MPQDTNTNGLNQFLQNMWTDYTKMTPQAQRVFDLLSKKGEQIKNDHIALRTFNHPRLGLESLARHFEKYGYEPQGEYFFKEKKLYAKHWEHPDNTQPKIFISELELEKTSPLIQETVKTLVDQIPDALLQEESFVYGGRMWQASHAHYLKLASESEYASWVYAYGFRPNHFTVSLNHLKTFSDLPRLNTFLKESGFKLNSSGGEIKGTAAELLEQSSTMAEHQPVIFSDGTFNIPGCYYEFAKRYPMASGQLYQGFIAQSADKIFESTNRV